MTTRYNVTMQRADGQIVEAPYSVQWDPGKVPADEVARACAAEHTCAAGFVGDAQGQRPRMHHAGLSAAVVTLEEELAEVAAS